MSTPTPEDPSSENPSSTSISHKYELFLDAMEKGDLPLIEKLLKEEDLIKELVLDKTKIKSAIQSGLKSGSVVSVERFLQEKPIAELQETYAEAQILRYALLEALKEKDWPTIKFLIERKKLLEEHFNDAIITAVQSDDLTVLNFVLKEAHSSDELKKHMDLSFPLKGPLLEAVRRGNLLFLKKLLELDGVKNNIKNNPSYLIDVLNLALIMNRKEIVDNLTQREEVQKGLLNPVNRMALSSTVASNISNMDPFQAEQYVDLIFKPQEAKERSEGIEMVVKGLGIVLKNSLFRNQFQFAQALLKKDRFKKVFPDNNHELLKMAADRGGIFVLNDIIKIYQENDIPLPEGVAVNLQRLGGAGEGVKETISLKDFIKYYAEIEAMYQQFEKKWHEIASTNPILQIKGLDEITSGYVGQISETGREPDLNTFLGWLSQKKEMETPKMRSAVPKKEAETSKDKKSVDDERKVQAEKRSKPDENKLK